MTVVPPLDDNQFDAHLRDADARVREYTKAPRTSDFVKTAAWQPAFLENLASEGLTTMVSSRLRRRTKEILAVAVSMTNGCEYCIRAHTTVLRKMFKLTEQELVLIGALTGHFNGLAALASALQVQADGTLTSMFGNADTRTEADVDADVDADAAADANHGAGVAATLDAIATAYDEIPAFYPVLAERPEFLDQLWSRDRAVMQHGDLTDVERHLIGLGVAATRGADYLVGWHSRRLLALGSSRADLLEAVMVIDAFNKNNKFTEGMLLDLGVWKPGSGAG